MYSIWFSNAIARKGQGNGLIATTQNPESMLELGGYPLAETFMVTGFDGSLDLYGLVVLFRVYSFVNGPHH